MKFVEVEIFILYRPWVRFSLVTQRRVSYVLADDFQIPCESSR